LDWNKIKFRFLEFNLGDEIFGEEGKFDLSFGGVG
jgi:hypothetical protein